jgi:hypothetical protein
MKRAGGRQPPELVPPTDRFSDSGVELVADEPPLRNRRDLQHRRNGRPHRA